MAALADSVQAAGPLAFPLMIDARRESREAASVTIGAPQSDATKLDGAAVAAGVSAEECHGSHDAGLPSSSFPRDIWLIDWRGHSVRRGHPIQSASMLRQAETPTPGRPRLQRPLPAARAMLRC